MLWYEEFRGFQVVLDVSKDLETLGNCWFFVGSCVRCPFQKLKGAVSSGDVQALAACRHLETQKN